jgi:hypothetical protein
MSVVSICATNILHYVNDFNMKSFYIKQAVLLVRQTDSVNKIKKATEGIVNAAQPLFVLLISRFTLSAKQTS